MLHLRTIRLNPVDAEERQQYPFNIPALQHEEGIELTAPVTFFVGENGSGKSTLIEALATAVNAYTVGSEDVTQDATLASVRRLADKLRLVWSIKTRSGFFLRAEDFFGYIKRLSQMEAELLADIQRVDKAYVGRSDKAKGLAKMPFMTELNGLRSQYGRHLNTFSHGESFLELFQSRLQPNSLYLLDEPETPLSPMRQLTLLSMMKEMVAQNCQFIVATHSPILMAFPGATLLSFDYSPARAVDYESLEHVTITRSFLNDPEQYLRHL
ncbi:ABC transporter, ATP-binding protein [hydrothermal vent metagenome]|uniref:ABC transporter, ATP-binding protein n=1 Tax=hydrothermal vent metagenome TaxID=652676 RepID=A0A3B0UWY8_9ZZZZ